MALAEIREPPSSHEADAASEKICPVSPESPVIGLQHLELSPEGQQLPPPAQPSLQHQIEQSTARQSAPGFAEAAECGAGELSSSSFFAFCDPASGGFALPPSPTNLPTVPLTAGFFNITSAIDTDASCTHSAVLLPLVASASTGAAASQATADAAAAPREGFQRDGKAAEMGQESQPTTGSAAPPVLATPLAQRRDPTGCEEGAAVPRRSTPFSVRSGTLPRRSVWLCQAHRVDSVRHTGSTCLFGCFALPVPKFELRQHLVRGLHI